MDIKELRETNTWALYQKSINYARRQNMYDDTNKNYRMYNGDQWHGLIISGIEPVQLNFIKPIVKYKVGTINQNLWSINYAAENYDNPQFRDIAIATCTLLNKKASTIWEKDNMDKKCRKVSKDAAINDEGIIYVDYDEDKNMPKNEILAKTDVYYGNENNSEIQEQPYILIKQRMPVIQAKEIAMSEGIKNNEKLDLIKGDMDYNEEAGDDSDDELDDMVTIITKMYKSEGSVWFSKSTKYLEIKKDTDSGLSLYPIEHFIWEEKEGSARGEGEIRHLIPNQLEVNKTIMRRLIAAKQTAYPQKIVNIDKIINPQAITEVGGVIKISGMDVENVKSVFANTQPAMMSPDVQNVQNELIAVSRELAGAGDVAAGSVNPESASGRAILAVQQAAQLPLTEQITSMKSLLEGLARIWLDMIKTYTGKSLLVETESTDINTGTKTFDMVEVPVSVLAELQATVKIDITPKGAFDKYAQELSLENLLKMGMINLEEYVSALDDDSVMPKVKLQKIVKQRKEAQEQIANINNQAQDLQMQAGMFLGEAQPPEAAVPAPMPAEAEVPMQAGEQIQQPMV